MDIGIDIPNEISKWEESVDENSDSSSNKRTPKIVFKWKYYIMYLWDGRTLYIIM